MHKGSEEEESEKEGDEEGGEQEGEEEGRKPIGFRDPGQPTKEEKEQHSISHIPFRSWCRHCVRGKATRYQHKRIKEERKVGEGIPRLVLDY